MALEGGGINTNVNVLQALASLRNLMNPTSVTPVGLPASTPSPGGLGSGSAGPIRVTPVTGGTAAGGAGKPAALGPGDSRGPGFAKPRYDPDKFTDPKTGIGGGAVTDFGKSLSAQANAQGSPAFTGLGSGGGSSIAQSLFPGMSPKVGNIANDLAGGLGNFNFMNDPFSSFASGFGGSMSAGAARINAAKQAEKEAEKEAHTRGREEKSDLRADRSLKIQEDTLAETKDRNREAHDLAVQTQKDLTDNRKALIDIQNRTLDAKLSKDEFDSLLQLDKHEHPELYTTPPRAMNELDISRILSGSDKAYRSEAGLDNPYLVGDEERAAATARYQAIRKREEDRIRKLTGVGGASIGGSLPATGGAGAPGPGTPAPAPAPAPKPTAAAPTVAPEVISGSALGTAFAGSPVGSLLAKIGLGAGPAAGAAPAPAAAATAATTKPLPATATTPTTSRAGVTQAGTVPAASNAARGPDINPIIPPPTTDIAANPAIAGKPAYKPAPKLAEPTTDQTRGRATPPTYNTIQPSLINQTPEKLGLKGAGTTEAPYLGLSVNKAGQLTQEGIRQMNSIPPGAMILNPVTNQVFRKPGGAGTVSAPPVTPPVAAQNAPPNEFGQGEGERPYRRIPKATTNDIGQWY